MQIPSNVGSCFPRLPKGLASFSALRERNSIYVDKTAAIAKLAKDERYVFLSRPRRFGKSLLVSTLESLFKYGLRDFKGLAIEKAWQDRTYPVVALDFSLLKGKKDKAEFQRALESQLLMCFAPIGFSYSGKDHFSFMEHFSGFLSSVPSDSLVLLIDEYDAPLTEQLDNPALFEMIRNILDNFFARLKSASGAFRFLFVTGITKYRQFLSLNNLTDISLLPEYGALLGFTKEEVEEYFPDYLENALTQLNAIQRENREEDYSRQSLIDALADYYGGYCFDEEASTHLLTPWSVLNFLSSPKRGFKDYWFESGGVSIWLENWIAKHGAINPENFDTPTTVDTAMLGVASTPSEIPVEVLLYQTGYLSIVGALDSSVDLGYPNEEVSSAMADLYLSHISTLDDGEISQIEDVFFQGNTTELIKTLNRLYLSIPYDNTPIHNEASARAVVLVYAKGAGLMTLAECHNARGRSDLEIHTGNIHWVFEFKYVQKDAEAPEKLTEALCQIEKRQYGVESVAEKRIRIGLVYSAESKQIVAYG